MIAHITVDENRFRIGAPRSSQVYFVQALVGGQFAIIEYVAKIRPFRGRCSRNKGFRFTMDDTILKKGGRLPKYKIRSTFYVAILIILFKTLTGGIQCILTVSYTHLRAHE